MTKQELEEVDLNKLAELAFKNAAGVGFYPGEFVIWIYGKSPPNVQVVRKAVGCKLWRHNCGLCGSRFAPGDFRFLGGNDPPNLSKSYCLGCVTAAIWYMKYRLNRVRGRYDFCYTATNSFSWITSKEVHIHYRVR